MDVFLNCVYFTLDAQLSDSQQIFYDIIVLIYKQRITLLYNHSQPFIRIIRYTMTEDLNYFATSLIASLTAFSLYKVISTQCRISKNQDQIDQLKNMKIKSPDDTFVNGERALIKGTVARNEKDPRNDRVFRQEASGGKQQYVAYVKFKETMYSNEHFTNKEQYVVNFNDLLGKADIIVNPSFSLKGFRKEVIISNFDSADYSRMLEITKWENRRRRLAISQKLQVLMLTYFRALGTLIVADRGRPTFLRGIDIGTREVETGLKVGASIMALGTIGVSLEGEVFLQPNILFKDRLSIIASIQNIISGQEITRNIWLIVLVVGGIYISRRIYKYEKKHSIIKDIQQWWRGQKKSKHSQPQITTKYTESW